VGKLSVQQVTTEEMYDVCFHSIMGMTGSDHLSQSGLELARVPRVPGTRRNSEHHLRHPRILRFLILTGTRRARSTLVTQPMLQRRPNRTELRSMDSCIQILCRFQKCKRKVPQY
jgi:hypothetical protein